jgi:hypothetical protein
MIEEKAPELAEQAAIEEAKEEKLLIGIEVVQPPKTAYAVGEQFSSAGMTVIARYSDNTTLSITNYTVLLQTSNGGFSAQSRALTVNDTAVRLSYTEGAITRTTTVTIRVEEGSGGTFTLNNIPSKYNGKYALLGTFGRDSGTNSGGSEPVNVGPSGTNPADGGSGGSSSGRSSSGADDITLAGAASINMAAQTAVLPRIANGSVSIPMWIMSESGSIARYSGNNTADIYVGIYNNATYNENSESEGDIYFELVVFSNGNATKSWNDG